MSEDIKKNRNTKLLFRVNVMKLMKLKKINTSGVKICKRNICKIV